MGLRMAKKKRNILVIPSLILLGIAVGGSGSYLSAQQPLQAHSPDTETWAGTRVFVPDEILVEFRSDATMDQIHTLNESQGMTILEKSQALGIYRLKVTRPVAEAVTSAQSLPFVKHARPNYVLAEVGGESITLLDMESAIQQLPAPLRQIYATAKAKETFLRTLVDNKVFAKAAKEENLDEMLEVRRKIEAAIESTLAQEFQRKVSEHISISEKDLRDYYDEHIRAFQTPEQIKIREIVVTSKEEALGIEKLIEEGIEFEQIARERSIGVTAQSGGELGWFGRGRLDPAIEQAGFALEKGEVSGVIETPSGFYVIKLEDRRSARQRSFLEVRNRVRQALQEQRREETMEQRRRELEQRYAVRFHRESLSEIKVYATAGAGQRDLMRAFQEILERHY